MDGYKPKPLLNKSELKQIKRSRTRHEGKKVLTDDVKKLKSLSVTPDLPEEERNKYYKEPIWIEYYIPRESRFAFEIKYLYVKLVEEKPRPSPMDIVLRRAMEKDEFIDVLALRDQYPEKKELLESSYHSCMSILETISANYRSYIETSDGYYLKVPLYLTEALMKREPSLATLDFIGNFVFHNLNWLIIRLNESNLEFSLEDSTISVLIKRRNIYWEENELPEDEEFDLFAALFYEQAFPHRGVEELEPDEMLNP